MKFIYLIAMTSLFSACVTVDSDANNSTDQNNRNNTTGQNNGNNTTNGTNSNNQNNTSGDGNVGENCQARCAAKAEECGAPAGPAAGACQDEICQSNPSESSLSCIEAESCGTLLGYFADPDGSLCELGSGKNNDNNDNNGVNNEVCIEQSRTGWNAQNNPSNCCDDRSTCFGNGNAAGDTICCAPQGNGCDEDSDCCGDDSEAAPAVCTNSVCTF